jgi:hypothetical protein
MTIGANRASRAAAIVIFVHDRKARADFRFWPILLQKSAVTDDVVRPFQLGRRGLVPRRRRSLRNSYATQYTEPERVAVAQPAIRAAAGSEQWRPEQTRPERLVDHAIEVDRASGSHLSGATAGF